MKERDPTENASFTERGDPTEAVLTQRGWFCLIGRMGFGRVKDRWTNTCEFWDPFWGLGRILLQGLLGCWCATLTFPLAFREGVINWAREQVGIVEVVETEWMFNHNCKNRRGVNHYCFFVLNAFLASFNSQQVDTLRQSVI